MKLIDDSAWLDIADEVSADTEELDRRLEDDEIELRIDEMLEEK